MIYIVIPVFNRLSFTRDCLDSLKKQSYRNFKVIVVDDGSTDGTNEVLHNEYQEVIKLQGDGNLFWTAATNLGVKYALDHGGTHILTLNNDTVACEDFLEKMVEWSNKYPDALFGALAYDHKTRKPNYGGEIINWKIASAKSLLSSFSESELNGIHEVTHFPGRGLLIPKVVFEAIGFYDEKRFPQYLADYDFTHRAIKAGFTAFCNYDAKIYIYPDESVGGQARNRKSVKNYYDHLFSIKSASNIIYFTKYAFKNAPRRYLLSFLAFGLVKRTGGYLRDWLIKRKTAVNVFDKQIAN